MRCLRMANRTEREQFATAAFRMCSQIIECATDLRTQPAEDASAEAFVSGFQPFDAKHVYLGVGMWHRRLGALN